MDEPSAALTPQEVERLFAIIRELQSRGIGVIYISHRLDEVFEIADRVAVLRDGNLVMHGEMLSPDGTQRYKGERSGPAASAIRIGEELAQELISKAGPEFLQSLKDAT